MGFSYAENLTGTAGCLKLPEGSTLVVYEKGESNEDGFRVDVFMDQLMTRRFGMFLLYARQLPSTHTLLSQYVSAQDYFVVHAYGIEALNSLFNDSRVCCQVRVSLLFSLRII